MGPDGKPLPIPVKPRKRIDRFDGISEDELSKKVLPDHLGPNLDIVIVSLKMAAFLYLVSFFLFRNGSALRGPSWHSPSY